MSFMYELYTLLFTSIARKLNNDIINKIINFNKIDIFVYLLRERQRHMAHTAMFLVCEAWIRDHTAEL